MLNNFTFQYPFVFLLVFLFIICARYCKARSEAIYFPFFDVLKTLNQKTANTLKLLKWSIIVLLITSLASPVIKNSLVNNTTKGYEISLVLDASGSMKPNYGVDKFALVKDIVKNFIQSRKNDQLSLSIFADFAYVAVPLTYDKNSLTRLLTRLDVGVAGVNRTALYEAIFLSSNVFKNSTSKNKIAIILTDGINNVDTIPLDIAIKTLKKYNIQAYTIGIGNDFNAPILKQIATKTNGKFFATNNTNELKQIYAQIDKLEKSEIKSKKYIKYTYLFEYPLFLAFLLLLFYTYLTNKRATV
jgi:Ca-activated chloride channel family protein